MTMVTSHVTVKSAAAAAAAAAAACAGPGSHGHSGTRKSRLNRHSDLLLGSVRPGSLLVPCRDLKVTVECSGPWHRAVPVTSGWPGPGHWESRVKPELSFQCLTRCQIRVRGKFSRP